MLFILRALSVLRLSVFVSVVLATLWNLTATDGSDRNSPDSEKASIRLKIGEYIYIYIYIYNARCLNCVISYG